MVAYQLPRNLTQKKMQGTPQYITYCVPEKKKNCPLVQDKSCFIESISVRIILTKRFPVSAEGSLSMDPTNQLFM